MFSYTSGTTGDPKGVKLTHKMIIGSAWAAINHLSIPIHNEDSYISYLPAAHSFEQGLQGCAAISGMKIGFFGGDVLKLMEDMVKL
jgi:long-chain acyl-CoA synthetase